MNNNKLTIFILNILIFILVLICVSFIWLQEWLFVWFGNVTIEQILFTMLLPLKGTASTIYISFVKHFLVPSFISSIFLMLIIILIEDIKYFDKTLIKKFKNILLTFLLVVFCTLLIIAVVPNKTNKFYNSTDNKDFIIYNDNQTIQQNKKHNFIKLDIKRNDINTVLEQNKNLTLFVDNNENNENLLKTFNDRIIVETFSIYEYNQCIEKGVLYPSLFVYEYENFKDIFKYNVKMLSVNEKFFKEYINMFKYLHKKKVVIILHISKQNINEKFIKDNLGKTCSMICVL